MIVPACVWSSVDSPAALWSVVAVFAPALLLALTLSLGWAVPFWLAIVLTAVEWIGSAPLFSASTSVTTTEEREIILAVQHLLELGHKNIAFFGSGIHSGVEHFVSRQQGYLAGLKAAGIDPKPEWHVSSTSQLLELLRGHDPVTAVFAETDTEAAAVARDVQRAGLRIPEDLSLIGFDDVFGADFIAGGLTTIYHPAQEMAAEGVKNLLALLAGSSFETCRSIVPTRVVKRHTTAPVAR